MFGSQLDDLFVLKSLFKKSPTAFLSIFGTIIIFIFAYAMRIIESPVWAVAADYRASLFDFRQIENNVWWSFVTITSIGYGDYIPRTILGRAIAVIAALAGVLFISLLILAMTKKFTPNEKEMKVIDFISRIEAKEKLFQLSEHLLFTTFRYLRARTHLKKAYFKKDTGDKDVKQLMKEFKDAYWARHKDKLVFIRELQCFRNNYDAFNEFVNLRNKIDRIDGQIDEINDKFKDIENKLIDESRNENEVNGSIY